jgi:hypothetical protein
MRSTPTLRTPLKIIFANTCLRTALHLRAYLTFHDFMWQVRSTVIFAPFSTSSCDLVVLTAKIVLILVMAQVRSPLFYYITDDGKAHAHHASRSNGGRACFVLHGTRPAFYDFGI